MKIEAFLLSLNFNTFAAAAAAAGIPLYGEYSGYCWGATPNFAGGTLLCGLWACTGERHFSACCKAAEELEAVASKLDEPSVALEAVASCVREGREFPTREVVELRRRLRGALKIMKKKAIPVQGTPTKY